MSEDQEFGYGYCPVQIEGTTHNGLPYYFRARGNGWTFAIATAPDGNAVLGPVFMSGHIDSMFAASWMPHELAKALTDWALRCYERDNPTPQAPATEGGA